jgi:hypothetical protein
MIGPVTGSTTTVTELAEACAEVGKWIEVAEHLVHLPDSSDTATNGRHALHEAPGPALPGNVAAIDALLAAHFGIRELEAGWRVMVSGTARPRGGSRGNTTAALSAISAMESAVSRDAVKDALRRIGGWTTRIRQLRSVDESPRWIRLRDGPDGMPPRCPYCSCFSLVLAEGRGVVACFTTDCADLDGNPPLGRLDISRLDGSAVLAWRDGLVQSG